MTYQWNFGDNSALASGANANHQYAAVGTYTAIVTATNNLGSASKSTTVTVRDVPISGLQAANNSPKAVGSAVAFTATTIGLLLVVVVLQTLLARLRIDQTVNLWWRLGSVLVLAQWLLLLLFRGLR